MHLKYDGQEGGQFARTWGEQENMTGNLWVGVVQLLGLAGGEKGRNEFFWMEVVENG